MKREKEMITRQTDDPFTIEPRIENPCHSKGFVLGRIGACQKFVLESRQDSSKSSESKT